jgi:hypothetical protein
VKNLQPQQFFHVTSQDALPSIKKHGLDNTLSEKEVWSNVDDWDDGAYMWDDIKKAKAYATSMRSSDFRPVVLGVSASNTTPDETGTTKVAGAHYAPHVPPENIRYPKRYR